MIFYPLFSCLNLFPYGMSLGNFIFLYAWIDGHDSFFGGWPGRQFTERETVNGIEYRVIRGLEPTDDEHHLIYHNNEGKQFDIEPMPIKNHIFLTLGGDGEVATSVDEIEYQEDALPEYYTLQGGRIENPSAPGIYVEKRGNKVSKISL